MNFTTIAEQEHSKADLAGIFEFHSNGLAKAAAHAINESQWVNAKGRVQEGHTGAFQVGHYVVFNSYSEEAFAGISKLVEDLHAPEAEREALWDELWASFNDANTPYLEVRELAVDYLTQVLPGATVKKAVAETDIAIEYNGTTFIAQLGWNDGADSFCIMVFIDSKSTVSAFDIYDDTADVKQAFDLHVKGVTPETTGGLQAVMFDLLAAQAYNTVSREYSSQMGRLSRNFLSRYLPKATYLSTNTEYEEYVRWVELWFLYKDKTYHLDFCRKTIALWTTNEGQENIDCAYVTVDTLQEKIDSVDDTGHFPVHIPGCTREEADEIDREIPRKSLEERLDKVEHLIASLQEEVTEIKKKL